MTYRVMAIQETGEEILIESGILHEHTAYMIIAARCEEHVEYRSWSVEVERNYYAEENDRYWNDEQDLY